MPRSLQRDSVMAARNGLERWRGQVDVHLENANAGIARIETHLHELSERLTEALAAHVENDEKRFAALNPLKTKVALIYGGVGLVVATIVDVAAHRLFGG